jgi:poly-gamma-glutamate capsule biosynthesis protein CapA/YwtB (metallophosphatase superfamily)
VDAVGSYAGAVVRRGLRLAISLVAASTAVACSGGSRPATPGSSAAPNVASAAASPAPSPSPSTTDITFAFAGDVHFMDRTATLLSNPQTAFGPITSMLSSTDVTIVNLETAITTRGTPEPKEFHFRTVPKALEAVRAAGVDAVSLANNHTLDYGQVGLADTLDAVRDANFPAFGAGHNAAEAYAPWLTTVRGVRVAVLGFSQIFDLADSWKATDTRPGIAMAHDVARATAAVAAARKQADLVVVFNHWGTEGNGCPNANQKAFAARLATAGADLIIGAHAHVLQGSGWLGSTYVAYGMGNFLWYVSSRSTDTGVLRLTVHGRSVVKQEFLPAVVTSTGQPVLVTGAAAAKASERFASLRGCTGLAAGPAS